MNAKELQSSVIFRLLKESKDVQEAVGRLKDNKDWMVVKLFVAKVKQSLLEATFEVDSLEDVRRYKYLVRGMESVVILPSLVDLIAELKDKKEVEDKEAEEAARRRKFNPGAFIKKLRKGGEK